MKWLIILGWADRTCASMIDAREIRIPLDVIVGLSTDEVPNGAGFVGSRRVTVVHCQGNVSFYADDSMDSVQRIMAALSG